MSLIYEPLYNLDRYMDSFFHPFRHASNRDALTGNERENAVCAFRPKMDLHENKETNLVTATFELPGLRKEDVSIDVHNGRLTVSAESKISSEREERGYAIRERQYGNYSRTLVLPQGVKDDEVKASMENGILTVSFPKTSPETASKKITIN